MLNYLTIAVQYKKYNFVIFSDEKYIFKKML